MKEYLADKKEEIREHEVFPRAVEVSPSKEFINAIVGPRRSGKTFFLYHLIGKFGLKDEDFVFVNFEDDEIKELERKEKVGFIRSHIETYGREPEFVFLDEVQELERWSSFLFSLSEKKRYSIFVTGSSSKLLSREIATQLRGRSLTHVIFPFSFAEYLEVRGFIPKQVLSTREKYTLLHHLDEYLRIGGFPQVVLKKIGKEFFREYINIVLYKDLVERFGVENIDAMRFLITSVIHSTGKEFSVNKVYRQIKAKSSVGNKTLYQYASYLEEALFAFYLYKFHYSAKKSRLTIPKVYINDPGILYSYSKGDVGRRMELAVFLSLKQRELRNEFEVFYWKDYQGREVDFLVRDGLRVKQLIQVTYASGRDEVEQREIRSLLKAAEIFKRDRPELLVVTWDLEDVEEVKGKKIKFVPLWRWLITLRDFG